MQQLAVKVLLTAVLHISEGSNAASDLQEV